MDHKEALDEIVETKLTRNELVDLILDDVMGETEERVEAAKKQRHELHEPHEPDIDAPLLQTMKDPEVSYGSHWREKGVYRIKAVWYVKEADMPDSLKRHWAAVEEADKILEAAKDQLEKITKGRARARIEIVRRSLNETAQGKKVLAMVDDFKVAVKRRLLKAGNARD